jgi:hypothetical protein
MAIDEVLEAVRGRVEEAGFRQTSTFASSMGKQYLFSDGVVDLEFVHDRGYDHVGLGVAGVGTFGYRAWANAIGMPFADGLNHVEQVGYFLANLQQIREFVATQPDADARLRAANYKLVAPQIGLDPNKPAPGRG